MKTIVCAALLMVSATAIAAPAGRWEDDGRSLEVFYSSLSPHGEWIAIDGASYAWRPHGVANDWRPYLNGHWLWCDQGWYWWSPEPWAWAVYHYGRWYNDEYYGWVWIPGYDWAPAWVEWRYGQDIVGWAPLGPYAVYWAPVGIRYDRYWVTPAHWWTFVGCSAFTHHEVWRHAEPVAQNERCLYGTRSIGSVRHFGGRMVMSGPDRVYIERRTNTRLENAEVVDVDSERDQKLIELGGRERVQVYRPPISRTPAGQDDRPPANVVREGQGLRLDPRGMERLAPAIREGGERPSRPEMHRMPRNDSGRENQVRPEWKFNRPSSRRLETERTRQVDPGDRQGTRDIAPRSSVREGKREGK